MNLSYIETEVKMPLMSLPVRTVIATTSQGRVMISPGSRITAEAYSQCPGITDIVAPNLFHCAGVPNAAKAYPAAKIWGVQGTKLAKPDISWTDELTTKNWKYQKELAVVCMGGMPKVNEAVFIHHETKSLIVTDLCFNMLDRTGFGAWLILSLFGTYNKFAVSKFMLKFLKDRNEFQKSLDELFSYDFENVVVSHGNNIHGNGKQVLRQALQSRGL